MIHPSNRPVGASIHQFISVRGFLDQVVILGHSLGALIGLEFDAKFPEAVERLILVDGGGQFSGEQRKKVFAGIQPTLDRLGKTFPSNEAYLNLMKRNPLLQPWSPMLHYGDREDAAGAIDAAQRAFEKWSTLTAYQRSGYLYEAHRIMTDKKEHLARVMTEEQGKPLKAVVRVSLNIWKQNWAAFLCKK